MNKLHYDDITTQPPSLAPRGYRYMPGNRILTRWVLPKNADGTFTTCFLKENGVLIQEIFDPALPKNRGLIGSTRVTLSYHLQHLTSIPRPLDSYPK